MLLSAGGESSMDTLTYAVLYPSKDFDLWFVDSDAAPERGLSLSIAR